jgi:DNA mismatch endonuclease (patch repair protein)
MVTHHSLKAPPATDELRSRIMRANRGKDTAPEMMLRRALFHRGLSGYRLHWKKAPGSPDLAYPGRRLAVFVNGCFWHRCPYCKPKLPKSNVGYWSAKFEDNIERDRRKIAQLEKIGWKVIVIWECEIEKDVMQCVEYVKNLHKTDRLVVK